MAKRKHESHVRLYRHELESVAYRSLSPEARALLVEMRALYSGTTNRVFMSRSEIMRRLDVGRCRAEKARDELIDRGFVRLIEQANFNRKTRHAPVYCLTNEPTDPDRMGSTVPKDYMKWRPEKKSSGLVINPGGAGHQPRGSREGCQKPSNGAGHQPREASKPDHDGVGHQPPDSLPGSTPEKPAPGWEVEGAMWRCKNTLLLNAQCATCRVWVTARNEEFDGKRHVCDAMSEKMESSALDRVPGGVCQRTTNE